MRTSPSSPASLPMNEFMQQSLAQINIKVEFEVVELGNLYKHWRNGAAGPLNAGKGITAINLGYVNADPKVDKLVQTAQTSFDRMVQDKALADIHQTMVDEALMLWVVHDTTPRALSPKVKTYTKAQHWFQDLTTLGM